MTLEADRKDFEARLATARRTRDMLQAAGEHDAFLVAHHHVLVLERRLSHWPAHPLPAIEQ